MFEDDIYDAFEFLNRHQTKQENSTKADKWNQRTDETHQEQTSFCPLQSEQRMQKNARRRPTYEIGIHKRKNVVEDVKEQISSIDENIVNTSVKDKEQSTDKLSDDALPNVSGITITKPLIKELEKRGVLLKTTESMNIDKECSEGEIPSSLSYEQQKLLENALGDFNVENYTRYLSYGRSNVKKCGKPKSKFIAETLNPHEKHDLKTLGDSLSYFGLSSHLSRLEESLEEVRKNKKSREDHEDCFKQIDKEIQRLSFKYHPDKVKNRGGTESEITSAQNLQMALNATRTALKLLNCAFIEDIGTDHKFGFYTKLSISSVCNEDEMKQHIYEVIFKIGVISRIKQQNIIAEIRKFLIESKNCVHNYLLGKFNEFEKARDGALFHLKYCIKGFKKLSTELEEVTEQCKSEESSRSMLFLLKNMASESKRDLKLLKSLKEIAKSSLKGRYKFFSPEGNMDPYFVLPLVSYTNIILMCNVMVRRASFFDILNIHAETDPYFRQDLGYMMHPYYLASYCSGNRYHEKNVFKIMGKLHLIQENFKPQISREEIESEFHTCIEQINDFMEYKFIVEHYYEAPTSNLFALDLQKCLTLMTEFQEKEEEVSRGIEKFQKKTEKMDEKYEKFDKMMEEAEEMNQKFKERLEKSKKLREKVTNALLDKL